MSDERRGLGLRLAPAALDQALWSGGNLAVSAFTAAAASSAGSFGAFAIAMSIGLTSIGLFVALIVEPFAAGIHGVNFDLPSGLLFATKYALRSAALSMIIAVTLGLVLDELVLAAVVGAAASAVLFVEAARGLALADGNSRVYLRIDVTWVALQLLLSIGAVVALDEVPMLFFVSAWGIGAAVAATASILRLVGAPPHGTTVESGDAFRSGRQFALELILTRLPAQLVLVLLGAIAGTSAAGIFRVVQLIFAPLNTAVTGIRLGLMPMVRRTPKKFTSLWKAMGFAALVYLLAAIPTGLKIGQLLGWEESPSLELIAFFGSGRIFFAATVGALMLIRVSQDGGLSLSPRTATALLSLVFSTAGAWWQQAEGAALGLAIALFVGMLLFVRVSRDLTYEQT